MVDFSIIVITKHVLIRVTHRKNAAGELNAVRLLNTPDVNTKMAIKRTELHFLPPFPRKLL